MIQETLSEQKKSLALLVARNKNQLLPSLNVNGMISLLGQEESGQNAFGNNFSGDHWRWRVGITFEIPPGIDSGDYTVPNEGNEVPGGSNGDLIVRVRVQPHLKFKRDGKDIFYDQDVSMIDAALGCEIIVPTLDGNEKIKVESGSQPNTIIKLKGKGVTHINSRGKGDQYVRIVVNIPKKLSKHQKKLLEEFKKDSD